MTLKYINKIKGAADKNDVKNGTCERSRRWQYIGILILWRVCEKLCCISLYFAQINLI